VAKETQQERLPQQSLYCKNICSLTLLIWSGSIFLKANYTVNESEIDSLEKKLDSIIDNNLRNRLEATNNFEILQNEKITPFFLKLAKGNKAEASLSDLLDDDGNPFRTDAELKAHIRNFYQKIY
jgi:hypothetical protein